ncbi:MAG: hypothetical protein AB7Q69_18745 [Gemmatimonadales bacterium]
MSELHLSERMPEVAAGKFGWTEAERRHLETCPDCRAEWTLVTIGRDMGRSAVRDLDAGRISAGVLARLAAEPAGPRWGRLPRTIWWVGGLAAAAAALVLLVGTPAAPDRNPDTVAGFVIPVMELDSLDADQLEMVLETMETPITDASVIDVPTLHELDDQQLERVLRSLEG